MRRTLRGQCSKVLLGTTLAASTAALSQATAPQNVIMTRPAFACAGATLQPTSSSSAPYSAVATTKLVRLLSDGNRIVREHTTVFARDGKGRTRTETRAVVGGAMEQARTMITIEDPVAGRRYVLQPELRRADSFDLAAMSVMSGSVTSVFEPKRGMPDSAAAGQPEPAGGRVMSGGSFVAATGNGIAPPGMMTYSGFGSMAALHCATHGGRSQGAVSLGERMINGVKAIGYRNEFQIAAGAIGNEQPIVIRTEEWLSPDLGTVIESTRHDPLSGDVDYRLTQIERGEPDAQLFAVPADYTIEEVRLPRFDMRAAPPAEEMGRN